MEAYLLDLVYRKVIDKKEYEMLLETQAYRRMSQKDWAAAHGVSYATVRSWHHRAEQAIQEHERRRLEETAS
jgi:DNA-directed RNA polymerase specialized sigma24 family protein